MSDSRNIYAPKLDLEDLAQALTAWYRTEQYGVERSTTGKGMVLLKCRRAKEKEKNKPSVQVTLRQQDSGLTADVELFKANKGWLIAAIIIVSIIGLLSLSGGPLGIIILLCAIGYCIFCSFSLAKGNNMPARTFTVIEQFVAASQKISPPSGPKLEPKGYTPPNRPPPAREEPARPTANNAGDHWDMGRGSGRSARDEPIGTPIFDDNATAAGDNASAAEEIVFSSFPRKGATTSKEGGRTKTCSCGEVNSSNLKFCEGCGKPL